MALSGRPSKLTPEAYQKARDYLEETSGMGVHVLLPTIERLANNIGVHRDTLYKWADEDKIFSDIFRQVLQNQADKLLQNSLVGKYNPVITKLMLSKHGYVEKTEQATDITTKGESIGTVNLVAAAEYAQFLKDK